MFLGKRKVKKYMNQGYDLNYIGRTQPHNINFSENDAYWKTGSTYVKSLHIPYDAFPENGLPDWWGTSLNLTHNGTTFRFIDHASGPDVTKEANAAIKNLLTNENRQATGDLDDQEAIRSIVQLRAKVGKNIAVKRLGVSFYIHGRSEEELKDKEFDLKSRISQFGISSNDGMQDVEYHLPFIPADSHPSLPTRRKGQVVSALDLAGGYAYNHTTLMDERGVYLGSTRTGGAVNFNLLQHDHSRNTPTMLVAGADNTGKNKLIAKQVDALFAAGHKIFLIDLDGKLNGLSDSMHGRRIAISDSDANNHINPMEVMALKLSSDGKTDDQVASFRAQQNKLRVYAQLADDEIKKSDLNNLDTAVSELYNDLGLWGNGNEHITDIVQEDYPILSDLVERLNTLYRDAQHKGEKHTA